MSANEKSLPAEPKWLSATARWALVLPAALFAPLGMWLLVVLTNLISGFIGDGSAHPRWIQIVGSAFLGYYFVLGGAKTAPSRRVTTAVSLATLLNSSIVAIYIVIMARDIPIDWPFWWSIVGSVITIGGTVVACVKLYAETDYAGEQVSGLKQILATIIVSAAMAASIFVALIAKLPPFSLAKEVTQDEGIVSRAKLRERLAAAVEKANQNIASTPFSQEDCPKIGTYRSCLRAHTSSASQ